MDPVRAGAGSPHREDEGSGRSHTLTIGVWRRIPLRSRSGSLGIYLAGVFVGALDMGILGPAFPLIARSFHVSLSGLAWTISTYTVAYVASTVLSGAAGDRHGRRRLFLWGVGAFGLASLVAALSHSFAVFLVARLIQGVGAGAVYPNAQAEGIRFFPPERRGAALGIFGAVFGLASIIGPNAGGALAQAFGWQAIFWINIPIALAVLASARALPESVKSERRPPDSFAGILFALFLTAALLALDTAGSWRLVALLAAATLLAAFVWRERRPHGVPFLDPKALSGVKGVALVAGAAVIGLDMSSAIFVPDLAQRALGFSVLASGVALMPAAFSGAILAGAGGVLSDRIGPRGVLQAGLLFGIAGGVLLALPHLTFGRFIFAMVAFGVATAFTMGAPLNRLALGLYTEEQSGEALAAAAVFRSVGVAAGPVLLALIAQAGRFANMFYLVAVVSALGLLVFFLIPDVRPAMRRASGRTSEGH